MPTYFSVSFHFKEEVMYPNLVKDVYSAFFDMGYSFKSGFWVHEKATLGEIISWNQRLLEKKFKLGFTQHVKHNYMQMLLKTDLFDQMRLFWSYNDNEFYLSLIVPEYDLFLNYDISTGSNTPIMKDKLNSIIELAKNIWSTGLVSIVQSFPEIGGYKSIETIENGSPPSVGPFCIVRHELFNRFSNSIDYDIEKRVISDDNSLLIQRTLL